MSFERRTVTVEPGCERPYDPAEWFDSLVVVQDGEVELHGHSGELARFKRGDVLWLTGLPVRALRNPGPDPAVLVAVSRVRLSYPA
jgi:quercetin dioxygenase-like cupin family protein